VPHVETAVGNPLARRHVRGQDQQPPSNWMAVVSAMPHTLSKRW